MFVGNVCYVTKNYNQDKFQLLLEAQLERKKGATLINDYVEQSIAAYLACKKAGGFEAETAKMENALRTLGIQYADFSAYSGGEVVGDPIDAVRAFNQIAVDYIMEQEQNER